MALTNHKYYIPLKCWMLSSNVLWLTVKILHSLQENVGEPQKPGDIKKKTGDIKIPCYIRAAILDLEERCSEIIR